MATGSFGEWLQSKRKARGWSQSRLARLARVASSTLNRWERGLTSPSMPELESLLSALGVSHTERSQALLCLSARRVVKPLEQLGHSEESSFIPPRPPLLGDLIRALRWRKGWSVPELAQRLQVTERVVRAWENTDSVPSEGALHRLCRLLEVSPEEQAFLMRRNPHLVSAGEEQLGAEERLLERIRVVEDEIWRGTTDSMDLQLLCLQAQAWWWKQCGGAHAENMLCRVFILQCQWLLLQGRIQAAQRCAASSWDLVCRHQEHKQGIAWLVQAQARATMRNRSGEVYKPLAGASLLQKWLPFVEPYPELESWFQRSIAECLALAHLTSEAIAAAEKALDLAQRTEDPDECHMARNTLAYVLILADRPDRSLHYLNVYPRTHLSNQIEDALLWCLALSAMGDRQDALQWLQYAQEIITKHRFTSYQGRIDQMARRF